MAPNLNRLNDFMDRQGLDAVVATSRENVTYLSGFWSMPQWTRFGPQAYVVYPRSGLADACLITDAGALDLVADQDVLISDVRAVGGFVMTRGAGELDALERRQAPLFDAPRAPSALAALRDALRRMKLDRATIGIDENGLLPGIAATLRDEFSGARLVDAAGLLAQVRSVKTETEVSILREAAQLTERALEDALAIAAEGVTEAAMRRVFNTRLVTEDALPATCCIGFGRRSGLINSQPSDQALQHGDLIRFDVGARYRNYRSDISRIGVFGEPDDRIVTCHAAVRAGVQHALGIMRPGLPVATLFHEVVETVRASGLPQFDRTHVGHGIGLDAYDPPSLSAGSDAVLEQDMVLCVETPFYELGFGGIQVEDMVRVTADGVETLMSMDSHLRRVG